jgi:hypothetical protein
LSDRGAELFAAAKALDEGVQALFRRAAGLGEAPKGTVRVSVNEPIASMSCRRALQAPPGLSGSPIELVIDNRVANLHAVKRTSRCACSAPSSWISSRAKSATSGSALRAVST